MHKSHLDGERLVVVGGDNDGQEMDCVMLLWFKLHFQFSHFTKPRLSDCYPIVNLIVMLT
jgi:hypothetical protein